MGLSSSKKGFENLPDDIISNLIIYNITKITFNI